MILNLNTTENKKLQFETEFNKEYNNEICMYKVQNKDIDGVQVYSISFDMKYQPFRESYNLSEKYPLNLLINKDDAQFMGLYHHRDWWTRPQFGNKTSQILEKTEYIVFQKDKSYEVLVTVPTDKCVSYISGHEDGISIDVFANRDSLTCFSGDVLYKVQGNDIYECISRIFNLISKRYKLPKVEEKNKSIFSNKLGWCSWDAFYTDINEQLILDKVNEFMEKGIPVKWILYDDGWHSINEKSELTTFEPDINKFKNGFKHLNEKIKKESKVEYIGVWHALGGYWGGLSSDLKEFSNQTIRGQLIANSTFFDKWYEYLKSTGIDFVKVDGQSALKNYFRGSEYIMESSKIHHDLENSVNKYFKGEIINCMGLNQFNNFSRKTLLLRNSDDFVPDDKDNFKEHLLQNSYNLLFNREQYQLDFDMFWSSHEDCIKHSILRAISGGPVYVSDKIGQSNYNNIMALCDEDGECFVFDNSPKLAEQCLFQSKYIILENECVNASVRVIVNLDKKYEVNERYFDLINKNFICSDHNSEYLYLAKYKNETVLGIKEKLNMPLTYSFIDDDYIEVNCSGTLLFSKNVDVFLDGKKMKLKNKNGLFELENVKKGTRLKI